MPLGGYKLKDHYKTLDYNDHKLVCKARSYCTLRKHKKVFVKIVTPWLMSHILILGI